MGWVAHPELVAGSCNAGAFGFLAGATIPPEEMERDILRVKSLTDKPFGVNFHMYQPNAADIVDMVIWVIRMIWVISLVYHLPLSKNKL